jgi:hypothetical protein
MLLLEKLVHGKANILKGPDVFVLGKGVVTGLHTVLPKVVAHERVFRFWR